MKKKILDILKKPFVRNVIIVTSGTAGAQLVSMLSSPVITRIYGPEAFGIMGAFIAMTSIIIPIAALSYPIAIVLPEKNSEAKGLMLLSLIITIIFSIVSLLLLGILSKDIIRIFNLTEIGSFIYLIPLIIIFAGLMQIMEQWLIRTQQFSINARVTFYQSIITNVSKIGIGIYYPIAPVLVVLTALANGIRASLMIFFDKKLFSDVNKNVKSKKSIKELAKEYSDFPKYRGPEQFLNATSNGLPVIMLTAFFGPASAGFYSIGRMVVSVPTQLIGKSVGDVFYPRIAKAFNNKEDITTLIKKATLVLSAIGIVPFGLIILTGPSLFSFVFGNDWEIAGDYARWIALWTFFGFINKPSVRALPVLSAQRFHLIYTIIMLIIRIAALAVGYFVFSSDIVAIALFGISGAILNLVLITITLKISRYSNLR